MPPLSTPPAPWLPYRVDAYSDASCRAAWRVEAVVRALQVETNPRYTPRDLNKDGTRETFCNIFLWDFTVAMGAEIPHWTRPDGTPCPVGNGTELSANRTLDWMLDYGLRHGWRQIDEKDARVFARAGDPTVALWQHHGGIGHVAAVIPARPDETYIAQAGAVNFSRGPLARGFGRLAPGFFTHA